MADFKKKVGVKTVRSVISLFVLTAILLSFAACSWKDAMTVDGEKVDFNAMTTEELSEYMEIGQYKGMTVALQNGQKRGDAVWNAVVANATFKHYPETHVYYYIEQIEDQYRYYAEEAGMSYDELLKALNVTDADIIAEAKEMTKKDILYAIVQKNEGITLTEEEKQKHFQRYVEMYVSDGEGGYGYTAEKGYGEEYVKANMADQIYESMLYDKTTEFLIINNTFTQES